MCRKKNVFFETCILKYNLIYFNINLQYLFVHMLVYNKYKFIKILCLKGVNLNTGECMN